MKKVYVVGSATGYANWLDAAITSKLEDADVVLFTGGADVHPKYYNEKIGNRTMVDSFRDVGEIEIYEQALALGKKMLGICRGSQFLTVMAGGKLIQDCNGHAIFGTHKIETIDGDVVGTTSTHHQMHYPYNLPDEDYEMLAWSKAKLCSRYYNGDNQQIDVPENFKESEIVWYKKINALAIQGHPEFNNMPEDGLNKCKQLFNLFMEDNLDSIVPEKLELEHEN